MTKIRIHPSLQKTIRGLNYDELIVLYKAVIEADKMHKDDKPVLLKYLEKRIKLFQKEIDLHDIAKLTGLIK
tara:strand:- start:788 stop:1003 length:216 start_codon:yes stop_codon:yes gene_type:complete